MKPGPRPTPTSIRILNGNPGKRPLNDNEPKPNLATPDSPLTCPDYLEGEALAEWGRITPILMRMKVLTEADVSMVANWCILHGVLMDAYRDLKKTGSLTKNKRSGAIVQNPLLGVVRRTIADMKAIATEYGLTSSARVRLVAGDDGHKGNKWADVG